MRAPRVAKLWIALQGCRAGASKVASEGGSARGATSHTLSATTLTRMIAAQHAAIGRGRLRGSDALETRTDLPMSVKARGR